MYEYNATINTRLQTLTSEKQEDTNSNSKNNVIHIVYNSVIALLIIGMLIGVIAVKGSYASAVSTSKAKYKKASTEYNIAYEKLAKEEKAWEKELSQTRAEAKEMANELDSIYAERQKEIDAENERWEALSEEEKQAEEKCKKYNEMVAYLRANNAEYAKLYVEYASYLDKDIFNIGKAEIEKYIDLYTKKNLIEVDYLKEHKL